MSNKFTKYFKVPKILKKFFRVLPKEIWVFSILTILGALVFAQWVDLTPKVDSNFFFSSENPLFQSENKISEIFQRNDAQVIISAGGDIHADAYQQDIESLSDELLLIEGIAGVKSITHGPGSTAKAINSPLWNRLLVAYNKKSTSLIIFLKSADASEVIADIEEVLEIHTSEYLKLHISGMPYIVEQIQRNLVHDLRVFGLLTILIFSLLVGLIFRSKSILVGTIVACFNACMWTLMLTTLFRIPIGILTANLITIVFVLTLSHVIFLTFNWKHLYRQHEKEASVQEAIKATFPGSFWGMITTLLGFISLMAVPAKPLKELGAAGTIGTIVAIIAAYTLYPCFLKLVQHFYKEPSGIEKKEYAIFSFLFLRQKYIYALAIGIGLVLLPGLWKVDHDPSLLTYFKGNSEIRKGLDYIDHNGGSSPLISVVALDGNQKLNNKQAYQKMWKLQAAFENHPNVGTVISLPVLLAEAKRAPLAFFVSWNWLIDILEKPDNDSIAKSFISQDRTYGLFLLRMREYNRSLPRTEIAKEIEEIIEDQGFNSKIMGGIFILQGHLANLVASSLIFGLLKLVGIFFIIGYIVSRSFKIAFAMTTSIFIIILGVIGAIGLYKIPLDIISAPAANIAIAIGIDSMLHMVNRYRRIKSFFNNEKERWYNVQQHLWQPVLTSSFVIVLGFGIFLFSQFPPTQRFGGEIVIGTMIAAICALFVMPFIVKERYLKLISKFKQTPSPSKAPKRKKTETNTLKK